jgi:hypothetical protein
MKKYLPSKKFAKFLLVLLGIVVIFFSFSIFYNKKTVFKNKNENLSFFDEGVNFYTLDSDEDGVYDWEESLWGLNPKDSKSNPLGTLDGEYVESKREEISRNNTSSDIQEKDLNQTDILARQFLSTASLIRDGGGLDNRSFEVFSESFDQLFSNTDVRDIFSMKDVLIGDVTPAKYKESLAQAFKPLLDTPIEELGLIERLSSGDPKAPKDVEKIVEIYRNLSNELSKISVPANLSEIHLAMMNGTGRLAIVFISMRNLENDPVSAMVGFSRYEEYTNSLTEALKKLDDYFVRNGII